ncbi:uncharacterized protein LOC130779725 isoform X2 [Actinidia eriantha]|uniref:uncharacterized protein LOC130779725 isoform X2 n=1 Tax=Actinidia eriantha TaxID=165200 RepID=UPI00258C3E7C|nr:uncharacterized protein LOC130779725 isoform X2 [Actinidia eriantha]
MIDWRILIVGVYSEVVCAVFQQSCSGPGNIYLRVLATVLPFYNMLSEDDIADPEPDPSFVSSSKPAEYLTNLASYFGFLQLWTLIGRDLHTRRSSRNLAKWHEKPILH